MSTLPNNHQHRALCQDCLRIATFSSIDELNAAHNNEISCACGGDLCACLDCLDHIAAIKSTNTDIGITMKSYIGTKLINAKPMTRGDYNKLRCWQVPEDENPDDEGYLVEYIDGGKANTAEYAGYVSWSPKEVFERAYRSCESGMAFGQAIEAMRAGLKVARAGWNGKSMFLFLVPGSRFQVNRPPLLGIYQEGTEISYHAHVDMRTAQGDVVPWLCSQTDMLAIDWHVVE